MKVNVELTFTENVLAGSPADPAIYERFVLSQKGSTAAEEAVLKGTTPEEAKEEELATLTPAEAGVSIFPRTDDIPHIYDYHVKGFLKAAAEAMTGKTELTAYKSKINKFLFVFPRKLYFERDGKRVTKPEGDVQRIVRAMTMQGPRTTPKKSECMFPGVSIKFSIEVIPPLGEKEIDIEMIKTWLSYGKYGGISEWVNGSNGRFQVTSFEIETEPLSGREKKIAKPKKEVKDKE